MNPFDKIGPYTRRRMYIYASHDREPSSIRVLRANCGICLPSFSARKHDSAQAYYQSLADMVEQAIPRVAVPTLCLSLDGMHHHGRRYVSGGFELETPKVTVALL